VNPKTKTALLLLSAALNAVFLAFLFFALTRKTASLSFYDMDRDGRSFLTAAALVSFPRNAGEAVFNTLEITLPKGESAALQFSSVLEHRQANWLVSTLYDHAVIEVRESGFGVIITAREPGEALMQAITGEGVRDIARVRVTE
jgi:hypothetical protein